MKQFLQFLVVSAAWAGAAGLFLGLGLVHPVAVFIVWIVGFVWMTGHIVSGSRDADYMVKVWLGMLAAMTAVAGIGVLIFS